MCSLSDSPSTGQAPEGTMSSTLGVSVNPSTGTSNGILAKERTIASASYNRWLVPPAALCIHLCIGMAYGFSVFWLPLSRTLGLTASKSCPDISIFTELFTTTCDWKIASLGWMYTLFFVFLGISAAVFGGWVERAGPRKAGVAAAVLWCGGLVLGAIGVIGHHLWLLWLGSGVIGGLGLGLGYISPVSERPSRLQHGDHSRSEPARQHLQHGGQSTPEWPHSR